MRPLNNEREFQEAQDASEQVRKTRGEVHAYACAWRDADKSEDGKHRGLSSDYWLNALREAVDAERAAYDRSQKAHAAFMATVTLPTPARRRKRK